jgi:hypothetical protein
MLGGLARKMDQALPGFVGDVMVDQVRRAGTALPRLGPARLIGPLLAQMLVIARQMAEILRAGTGRARPGRRRRGDGGWAKRRQVV